MMEFSKATGIIKTYACAIVKDSLRLVVELVIALEDILTLPLGDTLARISHTDFHLPICHIKGNIDTSTKGCELQGIREQIRDNLLEFITIGPCL